MIELEKSILEGFPKDVRYVSRDENGELWATTKEPSITDNQGKQFLEFSEDLELNEMYSLAIYNHLFDYIEPLSIMDLD